MVAMRSRSDTLSVIHSQLPRLLGDTDDESHITILGGGAVIFSELGPNTAG